MFVPTSTILCGLGNLSRDEAAHLVALFQDANLWNLGRDRIRDLAGRKEPHKEKWAFEERLERSAQIIFASDASDAVIRFKLWGLLQDALALDPALPFSLRAVDRASSRLAQEAARAISDDLETVAEGGDEKRAFSVGRALKKAKKLFSSVPPLDFNKAVGLYAVRMLADKEPHAAEGSEAQVSELLDRLEDLPPDQRAEAINDALRKGDVTLGALLASGGALAGVGLAVELAGFSAYILAAQASSILPLIGGKALVSTLFVMANPLFLLPALVGGGWWANRNLKRGVGQRLAASTVMLLALGGVAKPQGWTICLESFRSLSPEDVRSSGVPKAEKYSAILSSVRERAGGEFSPVPDLPPGWLGESPASIVNREGLPRFRDPAADDAGDAGIVAGLTLGDLLYTAASIDPSVMVAADFSRSADLSGVFSFGSFAQDIAGRGGEALGGAVANLKGYVAEQMVAAKLVQQGYQVSFPEASNNPGFDLLVDGAPFQVKCLGSVSGLAEHFDKYPDTPVIANAELAASSALSKEWWGDQVFFLEGYTGEAAQSAAETALEQGEELLDVDVPVFAMAVSIARNLSHAYKGDIALSELPFEVVADLAVRGGVSAAGGFVGSTLGFLVFGPAGAVVLGGAGGVLPLLKAGQAKQWLDRKLDPEWVSEVSKAVDDLARALDKALVLKKEILAKKVAELPHERGVEQEWIRTRIEDDILYSLEAHDELSRIDLQSPLPAVLGLCRLVHESAVHPWIVRDELNKLLGLLAKPPSGARIVWGKLRGVKNRISWSQ